MYDVCRESLRTEFLVVILLLVMGFPLASPAQQLCTPQVSVLDKEGNPIPEAKISFRLEGHELFRATSDTKGVATFPESLPAVTKRLESAVELTLSPKPIASEKVAP